VTRPHPGNIERAALEHAWEAALARADCERVLGVIPVNGNGAVLDPGLLFRLVQQGVAMEPLSYARFVQPGQAARTNNRTSAKEHPIDSFWA
jgi:hypothetical protein